MPKRKYTAEFKSKIIIAILQGDKEFNVICSENLFADNVNFWALIVPACIMSHLSQTHRPMLWMRL